MYISIALLFLSSVPLLVYAYNQSEESLAETYIERILYVRCEVHGEVTMPLLFPPNIPMFQIQASETDNYLFKSMDDAEQISILRERLRMEKEEAGFYRASHDGDNIVNICYLCATEEGRSIVKTFHDVMALSK